MIQCFSLPEGILLTDDTGAFSKGEVAAVRRRLLWPPVSVTDESAQIQVASRKRKGSYWMPFRFTTMMNFAACPPFQHIAFTFAASYCGENLRYPRIGREQPSQLRFLEQTADLIAASDTPALCGPLLQSALLEDGVPVLTLDHFPRLLRWMAINPSALNSQLTPLSHLDQHYPLLNCLRAVPPLTRHPSLADESMMEILEAFEHNGYAVIYHRDHTSWERYTALLQNLGANPEIISSYRFPFVVEVRTSEHYILDAKRYPSEQEAEAAFQEIRNRLVGIQLSEEFEENQVIQ